MKETADRSMRVAIAGITGKMARLITDALLHRHPDAIVHGIARNPDKVDDRFRNNANITIFQASSTDSDALRCALQGVDVCICGYLGGADLMIDGQKTLIDACIAENVPRYVASDWSIDWRGLQLGDHPSKDPMKIIHQYLEEKEQQGQISGIHIMNGAFMEVMWSPLIGAVDAANATFHYYGTGDEALDMATMRDAAEFTAEVAYDRAATGFQNYIGARASVKDMARAFEETYRVSPKVQCHGTLDDLYETMSATFRKDPSNYFAWMGMFYRYYMANGSTSLGSHDGDRYPDIKPTSLEDFLSLYTPEALGKAYMSM